MSRLATTRPHVLTIAGLDPSGGAGLVADVKTLEALGVYGLSVATSITVQHESVFERVVWLDVALMQDQLTLLFEQYAIEGCKIGLVQSWSVLEQLVVFLRKLQPELHLVVDPIFRATAGYDFHQNQALPPHLLAQIDLLTPNEDELRLLAIAQETPKETAHRLAQTGAAVLYKGGHNKQQPGLDVLYVKGQAPVLLPPQTAVSYDKHGSGCILSAAIAGQLALGHDLTTACQKAKVYTAQVLNSNPSLLGYHY